VVEHLPHYSKVKGLSPTTTAGTRGQFYETFYHGNLPPFHGIAVILCYKAILPWKLLWNGSKLPQYFNPRKSRVKSTVVIYCSIFITLPPGVNLIKLLGNKFTHIFIG
jgi:hypothetical protein